MSTYGVIDNLTYTYNGNQLTKVTDAANGPNYTGAFHFVDGSNATTEYEYDQNGNMTKDLNKKISRIQYNLLNLPSTIKIMNATGTYFINKTYDATGQLLRVRYQFGTGGTGPLGSIGDSFPDGGNEPQGGGLVGPIQPPVFDDGRKDYCGNIIYENNALSQILFDGGYITLSGTTPTYHYYLQDYLGNNRVVVKQDGTVEQVNHYYPFGSIIPDICSDQDIQPYKYNGKELDVMHGLNTYDYGARQYFSILGRWDRIDPLCEKYYSLSPYNYCGNNPIKFIDPNGMDWYKDSDNTYQYDPNINKKSKLKEGQTYIGESFRRNGAWYRNDGSILFNNETASYNRMWNQADQHYRKLDSGGREVGGFILKDGKVLVLPDYANDNETTKIDYYGYHIQKNGIVKRGDEKFSVIGQVHTHQNKLLSAEPSTYLGDSYGDLGLSVYNSSLPVFTIGHDKKIHGIRGYLGTDNVPVGLIVNMNSRDSSRQNLLNGRTSLFSIIQRLPKL